MCHHPLHFSLSGWPLEGGLDLSLAWRPASLPPGVVTIRPSSQCFGYLHPTTLLRRILARFSDDQLTIMDSASPVRR